MNDVAHDIVDPEKNIPLDDRLRAKLLTSDSADVIKDVRARAGLRIGALGSGSDYTAFIDHLGVASLNIGFKDEDRGGVYHSVYDDFYWYTHFSDTDFVYGRALAQTAGTTLMRFADADVLPYDFADFADTMHRYVFDVKKLLSEKQEEIRDRNDAIDRHLYDAASDPRRPLRRLPNKSCLHSSILPLWTTHLPRSTRARNGTPRQSSHSPGITTVQIPGIWRL